MKDSKSANLKSRAAIKKASRAKDRVRLENGESPSDVQKDNSIFSADFFESGSFRNLANAVGK